MNQHTPHMFQSDISISETIRPGNAAEIAEMLRVATRQDAPVMPVGGGTSLETGNVGKHSTIAIDVSDLTGVREYQPTDLTASFHAGTSLADVISILGEHDQELPLDLPQAAQGTIGGLVATGFSGPRRLGSGTLKDLLIGCEYVRGDGLIAKAGGMLVKNVSGFEITRLLHGSWGSLAVLTSVNVKVVPKPKADSTMSSTFDCLDDALAAQVRLLREQPTLVAAVVEREGDGWALHLRLLGRQAALDAQALELRKDLGSDVGVAEDATFWHGYNERWASGNDDVRLVVGAPGSVLQGVASTTAGWPGVQALSASLGTGSLRLRIDPTAMSIEEMTSRLRSLSGGNASPTWLVESAPAAWKANGSVWAAEHESTGLMRDIKREFDPAGVLNRGRLFI